MLVWIVVDARFWDGQFGSAQTGSGPSGYAFMLTYHGCVAEHSLNGSLDTFTPEVVKSLEGGGTFWSTCSGDIAKNIGELVLAQQLDGLQRQHANSVAAIVQNRKQNFAGKMYRVQDERTDVFQIGAYP